ncbi:MAG TPA: TolC family protein [Thermoanaerobaculia bacterium]|nr:TolC family protein [Thermoanaerobaculia bacterium]
MFRKFFACAAGALLTASVASAIDWNDPRSVVDAALAASPALREIDANIAAARARLRGAGATPNPVLMGGLQNEQIDFSRDPMTMYMVGASQTFVRGERHDVLRRIAQLDVERLQAEKQSRRAEITRDVLIAYDEGAAATSETAANEEIATLASMMSDAARSRYEVGTAAQSDIIRAKVEASNIRHSVLMQRGVRESALARLRALLNLTATDAIPSFALPQHSMEERVATDVTAFDASTPAIAALQADVARREEEIRLAKLIGKPDFSVDASYGFRPEQKDMFSVVGRIELPIRKSTTVEPRVAEAIAERDASRAKIAILQQQLIAAFGEAVAARNEAIDQMNLHVEQLVPEAKLGFESALTSYQSGQTTFDSVLGALQTYRSLSVDYYEFLRQLLIAESEIDALRHGAAVRSGAVAMGGTQ